VGERLFGPELHSRCRFFSIKLVTLQLFFARENPKYLQYWKYHLSFVDGEIFADIV
jgi:hypothetical protein